MSAAGIPAGPSPSQRPVKFRAMIPADIPGVGAVERASYTFPWSEGIFRDCLRVGYLCRVAECEGHIVSYGIVAMGAGEAHILNLCVSESMRGRSVGRQMLNLLLERSRQAGVGEVFLEVRPSNLHAIALYQSLGFIEVGRRKAYYQAVDGREDALVLKLALANEVPPGDRSCAGPG
jgi:ribosomal-protein-alanine N-acetyltransferase